MKKAFLRPPTFGAAIFAAANLFSQLNKPDIIYIPVVLDIIVFAVAYVGYFVVNAVLIIPVCLLAATISERLYSGLFVAIILSGFAGYLIYSLGKTDRGDAIDIAVLSASVFVVSMASFYYLTRRPTETDAE